MDFDSFRELKSQHIWKLNLVLSSYERVEEGVGICWFG
jgi:hypothetical protein